MKKTARILIFVKILVLSIYFSAYPALTPLKAESREIYSATKLHSYCTLGKTFSDHQVLKRLPPADKLPPDDLTSLKIASHLTLIPPAHFQGNNTCYFRQCLKARAPPTLS